jgi:probable selenium-dependent hydroxylase accessory protein YqeC
VECVYNRDVPEVLAMRLGTCAALVGGGGKTTTMLSMAQCLRRAGRKVLITTTTRIWLPEDVPLVCGRDATSLRLDVERHFRTTDAVALGDHVGPDGKLYGVAPALACDLLRTGVADLMLCEADGSAGRSLKAYRPGEPAIPPCASLVLVVAGIDAVGKPATPDVVHRLELFCQLVGVPPASTLEPSSVAQGLVELARPTPPASRVVYVLNKVDDETARASADAVRAELENRDPRAEVLLLSRGRVVAHFPSQQVGARLSPH